MIRVLVAEDSAVVRQHLVEILERDGDLSVVGQAVDGEEAVRLAEQLRPDLVLCDIHMPRLDGYGAARTIMERAPTRIVMATASVRASDARAAFDALECGALVLVEKPVGPGHPRSREAERELIRTLKLMAEIRVVRRRPARDAPALPRDLSGRRPPRVIAIAASTGGPGVVSKLLSELPRPLGCPVLLVQHITAGFTDALVEWLAGATRRQVELARSGERLRPDTVHVAPAGRHLGVTPGGRIVLTPRSGANGFCPSASHLFSSVADAYGASAAGIVLTGMGRDGADGLARLRAAGALTIAQDGPSSTVFGMPAAAIALGAAELVLPPARIVAALRSLLDSKDRP